MEQFANSASSTLNGGITNVATSLVVTSATLFPSTGNFRILIDSEIMLVTAVSGTTFTVTRAQEGTTGATHSNGAAVTHILTAAGLVQAVTDRVLSTANIAQIGTQQSTSSNTYADLATVGPAVTLTTGTSALVHVSANVQNPNTTGFTFFISVAVSGASTVAAADSTSVAASSPAAGYQIQLSGLIYLTGLTAGSNTFTMKYKVDGQTWNAQRRVMTVFVL